AAVGALRVERVVDRQRAAARFAGTDEVVVDADLDARDARGRLGDEAIGRRAVALARERQGFRARDGAGRRAVRVRDEVGDGAVELVHVDGAADAGDRAFVGVLPERPARPRSGEVGTLRRVLRDPQRVGLERARAA